MAGGRATAAQACVLSQKPAVSGKGLPRGRWLFILRHVMSSQAFPVADPRTSCRGPGRGWAHSSSQTPMRGEWVHFPGEGVPCACPAAPSSLHRTVSCPPGPLRRWPVVGSVGCLWPSCRSVPAVHMCKGSRTVLLGAPCLSHRQRLRLFSTVPGATGPDAARGGAGAGAGHRARVGGVLLGFRP